MTRAWAAYGLIEARFDGLLVCWFLKPNQLFVCNWAAIGFIQISVLFLNPANANSEPKTNVSDNRGK